MPAKEIGKRFSEDQIKILTGMKWWNWKEAMIAERADDFQDIEKFLSRNLEDRMLRLNEK